MDKVIPTIIGVVVIILFIYFSTKSSSATTTTPIDSNNDNNGFKTIDTTQSNDTPDFFSSIFGSNTLNAAEISIVASNAGFVGNDLITAVAIALAESGGVVTNYNPVNNFDSGKPANTPTGKGAIGLWQIYLNVHPEYEGLDLYDPQVNAYAAFEIYKKSGFRAWTTYTNKKYIGFLDEVNNSINGV